MNVYRSFTHKNPKLDKTQMFFNNKIYKKTKTKLWSIHTMEYYSYTKEQNTDTLSNMDKCPEKYAEQK